MSCVVYSCSAVVGVDSCSSMGALKQYHSQMIRMGLSGDNDAMGRVVKFCSLSKSGDLGYALKVLDCLPSPDAFIFNTIMRGTGIGSGIPVMELYLRLLQHSSPNHFTFPPLIRGSSSLRQLTLLHAHLFKFGFSSDAFSLNNLIHMYVHFQRLDEASRVLHTMPSPDAVSWTTLITAYSRRGQLPRALALFRTVPRPAPASWNAIIAAHVRANLFHEALALFHTMISQNVPLDKYVAATMLSACTALGALHQGAWIHANIVRAPRILLDPKLATTLIHMYCKCGALDKAFEVFRALPRKGVSSWNSMIGGLAMHGQGHAAIHLFNTMDAAPDSITFVNVLTACAHSGLIPEGRHYFRHMTQAHGIVPTMEHYGCMVDLLGRAGLLQEAKELIDQMPMDPDVGVLGALLGGCKIHNNVDLGEQIGNRVIELEPANSGRYVLLANLYAGAGRWEDVARVRKMMNDRGVNKTPGFSLIELDGVVDKFIAGGMAHPQAKEIYDKVDEVLQRIGYVPDNTDGAAHEEEEDKEKPLYYHSEKLAIAYGLLKSKAGDVVRITKNLRVCKDCHTVTKLVSKVYDRQIIVRDRNRFHHFRNGECSCKDYW